MDDLGAFKWQDICVCFFFIDDIIRRGGPKTVQLENAL